MTDWKIRDVIFVHHLHADCTDLYDLYKGIQHMTGKCTKEKKKVKNSFFSLFGP